MKIGTKTLVIGSHQFLLHPICVFIAWWKLYGFPWDPRLWFAFFLHDIGYWSCDGIDTKEGVMHPYLGGHMMGKLFGDEWEMFTLFHSREVVGHYYKAQPSRLCYADKLAASIMPCWLLTLLTMLSGEIKEYCGNVGYDKAYRKNRAWQANQREWVEAQMQQKGMEAA